MPTNAWDAKPNLNAHRPMEVDFDGTFHSANRLWAKLCVDCPRENYKGQALDTIPPDRIISKKSSFPTDAAESQSG